MTTKTAPRIAIAEPVGPEHKCPACGTPTDPSIYGRIALCLLCTEQECGEAYEQVRARAIKAVTKQQRKGRRS